MACHTPVHWSRVCTLAAAARISPTSPAPIATLPRDLTTWASSASSFMNRMDASRFNLESAGLAAG